MTPLPLDLYCASAGSGKTYTLSKKYILLLLHKRCIDQDRTPSPHKHILAITFTNKATTEMKERIIRDLFTLAQGNASAFMQDIHAEINTLKPISTAQIATQAGQLLQEILHDYSNFSVSTIDMFFQRLIRGFLKEVGIQPDFKLELNDGTLIQQAIDVLLERITQRQVKEHRSLHTYIQEMLETGRWNLRSRLIANAREVLAGNYRTNYLHQPKHLAQLESFQSQLLQIRQTWKAELKTRGETVRSWMDRQQIQESDFKYGSSGSLHKFLMTVSDQSYVYDFEKRNLRLGFEAKGARECGSKQAGSGFMTYFPQLQQEALAAREKCLLLSETDAFLDNLNLLKVFHLIGESILSLQQEQNMRRLSDAQDLIEQLIHSNSIAFLYEKAGLRYQHLLLDEFQDTSAGQWNCLKPLVEEAVSAGQSCLIVGDVKQSIYRWREGDWRILGETVPHEFSNSVRANVLSKNWRSCAQIVAFNNEVFRHLPALLAREYATTTQDPFALVYKDVIQTVRDSDSGGYVSMHFCEDDDYVWTQLGPRLHEVLKRGYACSDIAILVRDKKNAAKAAEAILAYRKIQADFQAEIISQESLTIEASVSVQWMLAMIRLAQLPEKERYYPEQLHLEEALTALKHLFPAYCPSPDDLRSLADQIQRKGLLWSLEALTAYLNQCHPDQELTEAAFIQAFHTLTNQFCQDGNPGLRTFLEWWDNGDDHYIQTPAGKEAISIMTVHKSKGLEFPVVFLPSCDFSLKKLTSSKIWAYPGYIPGPKIAEYREMGLEIPKTPLLLNWNASLKNGLYAKRYLEEQELDSLETLNLLYVAFTRAKCELHAWSIGKKTSLGTYLLEYFETQDQWIMHKDPSYESHRFCEIGTPLTIPAPSIPEQDQPIPYRSYPRSIALKIHPYAHRHPRQEELFESPRTYGILMHRILECLEHPDALDSFLEDDRFLDVPRSDLSICLSRIRTAMQNPTVKRWFSPDWEQHKEAEILLPAGSEWGKSLRPDRVLIREDQVMVIDYKFGEQALQQEAKHKKQILTYGSLIRHMHPDKTKINLYLWYVDNDRILEVT